VATLKSQTKSKTLYRGIGHFLTMKGVVKKDGRRIQESDLGIIENAAYVVEGDQVLWFGKDDKIPKDFSRQKINEIFLKDQTVMPAFTECHTHTVFAGNRAQEFEWRQRGVSYQEIAKRGGGILSTMTATRKATAEELLKLAQKRADHFLRQGVALLEIKTGYGLDLQSEIKCLEVIKKIKNIKTVSTFLGAHAIPPGYSEKKYLHELTTKFLPLIKKRKLSSRVDIFIENGFFSVPEAIHYLNAAKEMGFSIVVHADQLSLCGGSDLAVDLEALSAEHLIQIKELQIKKLAKSEVTAVLLPAADLYMKCAYPPARKLIDAGARVALATDYNPGSSPTQDLSLVGLLARLEMKMTLPEVIAAYTYNPWRALGQRSEQQSGRQSQRQMNHFWSADFLCTSLDWTQFFYSAGSNMADLLLLGSRKIDLTEKISKLR
jgi:imidazolonepropionase